MIKWQYIILYGIYALLALFVWNFYHQPENYMLISSDEGIPFGMGAYITLEKDWLWATPHLRFLRKEYLSDLDAWVVKDIPVNTIRIVPAKVVTSWQIFWGMYLNIVAALSFCLSAIKFYLDYKRKKNAEAEI